MMRRLLGLLFLFAVAGCRDSADILARDYRNLNNEAVDCLMMVTDEAQAKVMTERVLKEYPKRLKGVDDRVKNWKQNSEKDDYANQLYTSDSVVILIVESQMNEERLTLEKARLQKLLQRLTAENPGGNPQQLFPSLTALAGGGKESEAEKVADQVKKGGDVLAVLREVDNDQKLQASTKFKDLKAKFDEKLKEFQQSRTLKLRLS